MPLQLALADTADRGNGTTMEWPENCRIPLQTRQAIEADWHAPALQRQDEIAQLRATVAMLQQEVQGLRACLDKFRGAYNRTAKNLGDAVDALNLFVLGEPESLSKSDDELESFEPHIVKMIRAISYDEACRRKTVRDCGDWEVGRNYHPGAMAMHGGAAWIAQQTSKGLTPNHGTVWRRAPGVYFRGVWEEGSQYYNGDCVTQSGSSWICKKATTEKPGDSEHWGMHVKRGRDSRDREPVLK